MGITVPYKGGSDVQAQPAGPGRSFGFIIPETNIDPALDPMTELVESYQTNQVSSSEVRSAMFGRGQDWTAMRLLTKDLPLAIANLQDPARMTESEWKASEWYRDGIPWDRGMSPMKAETLAEWHDERAYRDSIIERGGTGGILGYGAMLAAQALDPTNYLPIVGLAGKANIARIAALGPIKGAMVRGAIEATVPTILAEPFLIDSLQSQGEDVNWIDGVQDVMFAAATGTIFGAGIGALERRGIRLRTAREQRLKMGEILEKAVSDLEAGQGRVDVGAVVQNELSDMIRPEERMAQSPLQEPGIEVAGIPQSGKVPDFGTKEAIDIEPPGVSKLDILKTPTTIEESASDLMNLDAKFSSPEIEEALARQQAGTLKSEHVDAIAQADDLMARTNKYEEGMHAAIECIVETLK